MRKSSINKRKLKIRIFSSFDEENQAEFLRMARMTPAQWLEEAAILQERAWGKDWDKEPMKRIFSIEKVPWLIEKESQFRRKGSILAK
jgi:hypothetical protein